MLSACGMYRWLLAQLDELAEGILVHLDGLIAREQDTHTTRSMIR